MSKLEKVEKLLGRVWLFGLAVFLLTFMLDFRFGKNHRGLDDLFGWASIVFLILSCLYFLLHLSGEYQKAEKTERLILIGTIVTIVPIQWYFTSHPQGFERLKNWISMQWRHPGVFAMCLTVFVVASGKLASFWKQKAQQSYSVFEVVFGALASFNTLYLWRQFNLTSLVALGAAMYVVSRGFNNVSESRKYGASAPEKGFPTP